MKRIALPLAAAALALPLSAREPALADSWENGPPRTNTWSRPMDRFETPAQRRSAIDRGARDYQPPAYRERDPKAATGLSGPPEELASPEREAAESRGTRRVTIFDRDRPMRAPRPKWYPAPEQEIPTPWNLPTPKE